ncbi:MAG: DMT family transporter [Ilumatobacteraceae bacterium]
MGTVIAASVAFGVGGAWMKAADGFTRLWPSVAVTAFFVAGTVLLTHAVRTQGLSMAYTLGLGVEAVVTLSLGHYVFHERLSAAQLLGVGMILLGVGSVRLG